MTPNTVAWTEGGYGMKPSSSSTWN
jgi:hypothetical protein